MFNPEKVGFPDTLVTKKECHFQPTRQEIATYCYSSLSLLIKKRDGDNSDSVEILMPRYVKRSRQKYHPHNEYENIVEEPY